MIRGSVVIAAIAVLLSLLLHAMGVGIVGPRLAEEPRETGPADSVELGNSFEDLVEEVTAPDEPEPAETPEPPVEEQPEPEPAEIPTSEVHVASDNPQQTYAPDTGESEIVPPEFTEPTEPEAAETEDTADGDAAASDEVDETPPAETAEVVETPEGDPDAAEPPVEVPVETAPAAPATPQIAEVPEPAEPLPSVAPGVPLESEAVDADIPVAESVPEAEEGDETSDLAVTSSVRPQRPDRRPEPETQGVLSGARDFSDLRYPSREIESPLTTYSRRGIDVFTVDDSGTRSGGRGPGNSDRTNYAGRVLVHLNRTPPVYTAARGFARVFFVINPDGTLDYVEVVDTNGSTDLERAAKAQVEAASPFPKPPGGVSKSLSFVYSGN